MAWSYSKWQQNLITPIFSLISIKATVTLCFINTTFIATCCQYSVYSKQMLLFRQDGPDAPYKWLRWFPFFINILLILYSRQLLWKPSIMDWILLSSPIQPRVYLPLQPTREGGQLSHRNITGDVGILSRHARMLSFPVVLCYIEGESVSIQYVHQVQ